MAAKKDTSTVEAKKKVNKKDATQAATEPSLIADNTVITLTLPWAQVSEAYQAQLKRFAKNIKVDGFRRGKLPAQLVEKHVDRERLIQATLEKIVPSIYEAEITKGNYKPLTYPDFTPKTIEWNSDWTIEAQFAQAPEITITGYQAIVTKAKKEAEKTWKELQKEKAEKDAENQAKTKEKTTPTKTEAEVAKEATAQQEAQKEHSLQTIFRALTTELKPAVPELLIREQTKQELHELEKQLKQFNATIEQFLEQRKQSFEDLTQEMAAQTLAKLQLEFVLRAIQEDLKISVTDEAIQAEYESIVGGGTKTTAAAKKSDEKGEKTKKADKPAIPAMSADSKEYLRRTLERRALLDAILEVK